MVVSQLLEPEQVDVKRGCVSGTGTGIFWKASNAQQKCANLFHRLLVSYCLVLVVTCCDYIALFRFSLFGVSNKMILAKQGSFSFIHGYPLSYQYILSSVSFVSSYFPSKLVSSLSLSAILEWPVEPVLL